MLASIDLGTNSARLLIGQVNRHRVITVRRHRIVTKMGTGLKETGHIERAALARTAAALEEFRRLIEEHQASTVAIVATSAARRAANVAELVREVERIFGVKLRILDGREEAILSFKGALSVLPAGWRERMPVVIDIGGGSTEICFQAEDGLRALSLELGAVRLTENPISAAALRQKLVPLQGMLAGCQAFVLVGVGGTVTSLAAMEQRMLVYDEEKINGYRLSRSTVDKWLAILASLTLAERQKLPGLEPARADIIVAGTQILQGIMDSLGAAEVLACEGDLLHGLLLEYQRLQG
ncbi:MAG TPA: Ppx/GppA family phosphatase [Clostridia bacterium]|nr:Ppx/GppA family phosphatase [Clostridia bacterium]